MSRPFPILIVALDEPKRALALGGVLARLLQEVPNAAVTLVTRSDSAALFADFSHIEEILAFDGPVISPAGLKLWWRLRQKNWGLLLDTGPTLWSRFLSAKTRAIAPDHYARNLHLPEHPVVMASRLLRLEKPELPWLHVAEARGAGAAAFLEDTAGEEGPLLAIAPGARWQGAQWPAERFSVLATRLMNEDGPLKGARLLILGNETDREAATALRMAAPKARVVELTGKLDPLTAYACLRQASVFIGNDDIWLHLAAAANVLSFGLYGPSDERVEAPLGNNVHILRTPRHFEEIRAQDPNLDQALCHMLDLSVNRVYEAVQTTLSAS
ncbi:glycosyltransferase family 9 protein [Asticcacaulis sp. AND118]|uniref:glycosyltransferase family 9 protein n=1 Tax=Asticcacaulis sp. AND118 TaxID=2840468 RepID=UPI001CFF8E9B|nr:glycosyltransferase family 9 protein [Asticcacaulis sp. AND118]UDF02658.1 glycosyltransferase family 9 protein [Asticcacaulis sp. AND118]